MKTFCTKNLRALAIVAAIVLAAILLHRFLPASKGETPRARVTPEAVSDFEAEHGTLTGPMALASDPTASGRAYIFSSANGSGTATFTVDLPAGEYVLWTRVLAVDATTDSFHVSIDGGAEDIFDAGEGSWSDAWQWKSVNGRAGALPLTLNPRVFSLASGTHSIVFRGRDPNTKLDYVIITDDLNFVPTDAVPTPTPSPTPLPSPTPIGTPIVIPTPTPGPVPTPPLPAFICAGTLDPDGTLTLRCPRVSIPLAP